MGMHNAFWIGKALNGLVMALPLAFLLACSDSGFDPGTAPDRAPVVTSILLSHSTLTIEEGSSAVLTATVLDQERRPLANSGVAWNSASAWIASVNAAGQVIGKRQGRARITASVADVRASLEVLVLPLPALMLLPSGDRINAIPEVQAPLPLVVQVLDRHGNAAGGVSVRFSASAGGGVLPDVGVTDDQGIAATAWTLAPGPIDLQTATASVPGLPPVTVTSRATTAPQLVLPMLQSLPLHIDVTLASLAAIPLLNANSTAAVAAKMEMLRNPLLVGQIVSDRRWVESAASSQHRSVPIAAVFPLERMRAETAQAVGTIAAGLPLLEEFMGVPFPQPSTNIWNGFGVASYGGGGNLFVEDRGSYEFRTSPATRLPYDAIVLHELAHSYIGNESLTQFLEIYLYNVLNTGSSEVTSWNYTRNWFPGADTNVGVHALLDVYLLIGRDAMARAYHAVYPLRPLFNQPLTQQAQHAFVNQSPAALRAQVAGKMAKVSN
jgi:hypothetical protein